MKSITAVPLVSASVSDAVSGMKPTQGTSAEKEVRGQLIPLALEGMNHSLGVLFLSVDMTVPGHPANIQTPTLECLQ